MTGLVPRPGPGGRRRLRRVGASVRRVLAASLGPVLTLGGMALPPAALAGAVAAVAAASVAAAHPAKAAPPGKALVLLQNGETTAPETTALRAAGWSVDQATPATWLTYSAATFKSYAALVIGDPSTTSSCSTLTPTTATSGTDAIGTTWQSAVSGNVAVLGTGPAAAGTTAASNLITAAVGYAAAGYASSSGTGTGLYVSLNCEYKTAAANTAVPLLNGVEGIGATGGLKVRGNLACGDNGMLNKWAADASGTFAAVTSTSLRTPAWTTTGCPVEAAFNTWPATFTPVAFDTGSDVTQNFTSSSGIVREPYILLGAPAASGTAALASSTNGVVPAFATVYGGNPAAPGAAQTVAGDGVNTENGSYSLETTDLSVPGFGPALEFSRAYDSRLAQQQLMAGTPGQMGYGWTDSWATSVTTGRPVPGDIYRVLNTLQSFAQPSDVAFDAHGDVLVADTNDNRVDEIAAYSHTQFGVTMTAGDAYTVAGSTTGASGNSGDGGKATSALMFAVSSVALDAAGDLYMVDQDNNQIREVPAATGTQWGQSMTANDIYTIAGSTAGTAGDTGNGGKATSALLDFPQVVRVDAAGNVYIADELNSRVQEIAKSTGTQRGVSMTANDVYTIAGSATGANGDSGDGGAATSALLNYVDGLAVDPAGDVYVADSFDNVVREVAGATGTQWGKTMTANDIYTVAGSTAYAGNETLEQSGDGGPATAAALGMPAGLATDSAGDLYIADMGNNRIQEVPVANGVQWGQLMTAGDMYTVLGAASGTFGNSGDGGPATSALLDNPYAVAIDPSGDVYIPDTVNNKIREVFATTGQQFGLSPAGTAITISQADGSQVIFTPKNGSGACTAPYVAASGSGYCSLPEDLSATLTYNSSAGTYTYSPTPGESYTYSSSSGALRSETDGAGDTLTVTANSPAPGSGNCPSAASSCRTIIAATGKALVIGANSSGLVTSVTDPMARRWAYAYNSSSQLTSATDPLGHVTSFTYGAGSTGNPLLADDLLTTTGSNAQPGGPDAGDASANVYDAFGRVTSQTDPAGNQTTFNYCVNAAPGDCMNAATGTGLVTVTDPDGNATVYDYLNGVTVAQTAGGREVDTGPDWTGSLLPLWISNGADNRTAYAYQSDIAVATTDPDGNVSTSWSSGTLKTPSCSTDPTASVACGSGLPGPSPVTPGQAITPPALAAAPPAGVTYALYDTDGDLLYETTGVYQPGSSSASSLQTSYTLYSGNSVVINGATITCAATPPVQTLPCAQVDPSGSLAQIGYDSAGDTTSESTPDGNGSQQATETFTYNQDGQETSQVSPDGNVPGANAANYTEVLAYDADGQTTSTTDAGGAGATVAARTMSYTYDADGNQTSVTDPMGYVTTMAYNADDGRTLVTDPDGRATLTCFDGDNNITQSVPPSGVVANQLTPASCPTAYPAGYSTRLAADALVRTINATGDVTSVTSPAPAGQSGSETTTYAFDAAGRATKATVPAATNGGAAQTVSTTYDADGRTRTKAVTTGATTASTVSFCYDPDGRQTSVVPAEGNINGTAPCETTYPWVVSAQSNSQQAGFQATSTYDSAGEVLSTTGPATAAAPNGATTTYTYDAGGNVTATTDPNGATENITYATPGGRVTGVTYSGSVAPAISYSYDAAGTQTNMTDGTGASSYTYDPFGELTSTTNGAGQTVGYTYDADGNTTGTTYPLPASATWATSHTIGYAYDHAGTLTSVTDFNGHAITITPNGDGAPSSESLGATGDTVNYTYDAGGVPSGIAMSNGSSTLQSFSYSDAPAGDILSETDTQTPTTSAAYTYDTAGRLSSASVNGASPASYTYDASGDLAVLPAGASATYDPAGESTTATTSSAATSYSYNSDGERLAATQGSATVTAAAWNGAQQLSSYSAPAGDMTAAAYDGTGMRTSATTAAGTQDFVWGAGSDMLMDSANAYIYATGAAPAEQVNLSTGAISYLSTDALGSVRGVVSSSGSLTATTAYDAWGSPKSGTGLSSYTPFGYAAAYTDPTGLLYLGDRYYDPTTAQFLSVDPAVGQTGEPYQYAGDNPVNGADPSGDWMVGIPSDEPGFFSEDDFQLWVNETILGGTENYWVQPSSQPNKPWREIDIFQASLGWLNEMKVGPVGETNGAGGTKAQAHKDSQIIKARGNGYCHNGLQSRTGQYGCWQIARVNGGNWWFGYSASHACQRSNITPCPTPNLIHYLLRGVNPQGKDGDAKRNVVLVVHWSKGDGKCGPNPIDPWRYCGKTFKSLDAQYQKNKTKILQALQTNTCPDSTLEHIFPILKASGAGC